MSGLGIFFTVLTIGVGLIWLFLVLCLAAFHKEARRGGTFEYGFGWCVTITLAVGAATGVFGWAAAVTA